MAGPMRASTTVVIAAKSLTVSMGSEIRMVQVPKGEIWFRKQTSFIAPPRKI